MKTSGGMLSLTTLLAPISWGSTYWVVTEMLPADRPFLVAAMRVLPAGLLLIAIGVATSGWRPRGREWRDTAVLALFNFALFMPLLVAATYRVPGGVVASLGGLQPLLVAMLTWAIRGERPRGADVVIGAVAAAGVVLVVGGTGDGYDAVGVAAALGANVSFAIGVVLTRALPTPRDRVAATGWQLLMGALVIVPLAVFMEGTPPHFDGVDTIGFAYISLIATGLAAAFWFNGIRRLPVQAPPLLGLASAATGVVLGWLLLGQSLAPSQLAGLAITISAIAYGAALGSARRPRPPLPAIAPALRSRVPFSSR